MSEEKITKVYIVFAFDTDCDCWRPVENAFYSTMEKAEAGLKRIASKGWWSEEYLKIFEHDLDVN